MTTTSNRPRRRTRSDLSAMKADIDEQETKSDDTKENSRRHRSRSKSDVSESVEDKDVEKKSAVKEPKRGRSRTRSDVSETARNETSGSAEKKEETKPSSRSHSDASKGKRQSRSRTRSDLSDNFEQIAKEDTEMKQEKSKSETTTTSEVNNDSKPQKLKANDVVLKVSGSKRKKNALSNIIPGYTAPLKLVASSINTCKAKGGINELHKRALKEQTAMVTAPLKDLVASSATKNKLMMTTTKSSFASAVTSFKMGPKKSKELPTDAGNGWFGFRGLPITAELKQDLTTIRNRNYLDPKRFYKSSDQPSKFVQVGTVIEGTGEYFSSRLTKKQRRSNLTEEMMADPQMRDYALNKFKNMQRAKSELAKKQKGKRRRVK